MSCSQTHSPKLARKLPRGSILKSQFLAFIILSLCLVTPLAGVVSNSRPGVPTDSATAQSVPLARLSEEVTVRAAGLGNPTINLSDGHELLTPYVGREDLRAALEQNQAEPLSLASADFDEDGVPDLISGYGYEGRGIVTLLKGNVDAIYPNAPEAQERKTKGTFTSAPFLSPAQVFGVPITADFIGAGDFDGDSHWDVVAASRTSNDLTLLSGYGNGAFKPPREIPLPGLVTAMETNEINRRDGLTDLIVGLEGPDGPQVLVFEGPTGALQAQPEVFMMPASVKSLALGQLDANYEIDLAVAAGRELFIIHGRDRQLLLDPEIRASAQPAWREQRAFPVAINSMVLGNFSAKNQTEIALLFVDGSLKLLSQGTVSEAKQVAEQSIALWDTDELARGDWTATMLLGSSKVSSLPGDELLAVDASSGRIHIMRPGQPQVESVATNGSVKTKLQTELVSLESEGGVPVAVVPMRLNADALSDLTMLKSGKSRATTITTSAAMTFVVTNTNDSGPGSLRQAVTAAEANQGADAITFQIGSGPQTIALQSFLPNILDPVTIDATTQPGFAGQPLIEMNGQNSTVDFAAFDIFSGNSTVRGFVINRFHSNGLSVVRSSGNIIEGNYIGTDVTGTVALPNDFRGIGIGGDGADIDRSLNNRIGGTTPQARNVISGNKVHGVRILNIASTGNTVQGNYIGTDVTGTVGIGNKFEGIYIGGANNNTVGGTEPGAGNLISSNGSAGSSRTSGVHIGTFPFQSGGIGNLVQGNRVGTNASGTAAISNANEGVVFEDGASSNTIGGTTASARNIISGNGTNGVDLGFSKPVTLNQVLGNYIGTDVTGNNPLGNNQFGIFINVNSVNNTIRDNRIAFNVAGGIFIPNTTPDPGEPGVRIAIDFNEIFSNGGLGIDLGSTGITPNDPLDTDVGANLQQNFPVLTGVVPGGARADKIKPLRGDRVAEASSVHPLANTATVNGTLNSTANTTFTVHWYFSNSSTCSNNQAQSMPLVTGRIPDVITDGSGNASFLIPFEFPPGIFSGTINCTATDPNGNTSEFSACLPVNATPTISISDMSGSEGNSGTTALTFTVSLSNSSPQTVTVNYATADGTATTVDSDYSSASNTLTFDPGQTSKPVTVLVNGDGKFEPNENFVINLSSPTNAVVGDGQGQGTIVNDDLQPTLSINDVNQNEGNSGTTSFNFNVSMSNASSQTITVNFATANGTAMAPADYQTTNGTLTFNPGETSKPLTVLVNGETVNEAAENFFVNLSGAANASITDNQGAGTINNDDAQMIQFSAGSFNVTEGSGVATVTVSRAGDVSSGATVDYITSDTAGLNKCNVFNGVANSKCDYIMAVGKLQFAAGEISKTISILIVDDAYAEGSENLSVNLSNATGATLGAPSSAMVTINDNETAHGTNPIQQSAFFVRQHYLDFLNREADTAGLNHWIGQLSDCGNPNPQVCRISVSAAFFLSIEFQDTGYFAYRMYKVAYGDTTSPNVPVPVPIIRVHEFLPDSQAIGRGVVVGVGEWKQQLDDNKNAYAAEFVTRQRFLNDYPQSLTPGQFVDQLNTRAGGPLSPSERDQLVNALTGGTMTRAQVLRAVAEDQTLKDAELRRAFVLMQYYGYLRRNPDDPQDLDFRGWKFWLDKLNEFNGDFAQAQMVQAFLDSIEYNQRFGP